MTLNKRRVFLPAFLFVIACAYGQDVHYNYDHGANFAAYKSYEWVDMPGPGGTVPDQLIDQAIKQAVNEQGPDRAEPRRSGHQLRAPAPGHGAGRGHPLAVRRQDAAGDVRSRHRCAAVARPDRSRRRQCARRAEPHHPGRHGEDRRLRIHRQSQQRAVESLGSRRPADQERRRRDGLHARRRPGAQRQCGADQCRARRRQSLGAAQRVQEWDDLDARHRQRHQEDAASHQTLAAGRARHQADRRSVDIRARLDPGRDPRRRDRRGADQPDDPACSSAAGARP